MSDIDIELGYELPGYSKYESADPYEEIATAAEAAGFETLWTGDHISIPEDIDYDAYPFGAPDWADISNPRLDVFGTFSYVAAVTDEITMGTSICVVPLRHPILLAKQALTVSALSDGRFEFGVGPGWLRSEFRVLDAPFEQRGKHTDEFLAMFEKVFENDGETRFDGELIDFEKTGFHPLPDEKPPIWIGGTSGAALRRTAEYGDGWTVVDYTAEEVASMRERLMIAWRDFERDGVPEISAHREAYVGDWGSETPDDASIGDPADIIADIKKYADSGTTHLIITSMADSLEEEIEQIHRFGDEIIPTFE